MEEPANRGRERCLAELLTRGSQNIMRRMMPALNRRSNGSAKRSTSLLLYPSKPRMDSKRD
ncbi:MAG: hypothetical protein QOJ04_4472 [Caballeronia sp.]|nr:hypothetical protein [Caballeronia sp.]